MLLRDHYATKNWIELVMNAYVSLNVTSELIFQSL